MGTYLSTPVLTKGVESGELLDDGVSPLAWALVDMQGWRKSMEDAHVADTNVDVPLHLILDNQDQDGSRGKVFGVFDGHGGAEVARFCQLYLVDVLSKQQTWKEDTSASDDPRDPSCSAVGQALIDAFHALDRMIDDRSRREELIRLRTDKPAPGQRRTTDTHSIPPAKTVQRFEPVKTPSQAKDTAQTEEINEEETKEEAANEEEKEEPAANPADSETTESSDATDATDKDEDGAVESSKKEGELKDEKPEDGDGQSDEDSTDVVGKEEAAEMDQDDEENNGEVEMEIPFEFQNLIGSLEGDSGQVMASLAPAVDSKSAPAATASGPEATPAPAAPTPAAPTPPAPPPPTPGMVATIIQNGRQICNLPDHPIHAGCTAVVAVLIGRTLTVANAGDSRAVLCRVGGRAEALSFDHKPLQDREMARITTSGGFVNQFGRVNGNLNLSRSIGDLKYKQIPGLSPAEQMITAEPDIVQVTLHPKDEFVVLGCDGIWDCLTNDQAVKYVRDRIDTKTPTEIGIEMLDEIISEDPRATQGIGGDNMTIMVVDLQPSKRAYR